MKLLDLFAGIGGFSLAAHWMGWETAAFVEREPFCQKVLRKNFGENIEIHDDIFTFSGKPFRGRVDIITGGFPCQPFSAAGKRKGRADERHLFPEMLRVISEVKPRWVVAENVRGLLSIENGAVFAEVVTSLESEGYEVITFCIPASAVEAPHRRDRLWIVAKDTRREYGAGQSIIQQHEIADRSRHAIEFKRSIERLGQRIASDANIWQSRSGNVAESIQTAHFELGSNNANDPNRSNTRTAGRQRQQADDAGPDRRGRDLSERRERADGDSDAPDAQSQNRPRLSKRTSKTCTNAWSERWVAVAARTCVRGVDARLSPELDVVGARDNRVPRLKALGNAVVPQIPYEIFKAIEAADGE